MDKLIRYCPNCNNKLEYTPIKYFNNIKKGIYDYE